MNDRLDFSVLGMPVPQGSFIARIVGRGQRPMVVADNEHDLKRWRKKVAAIAGVHMQFRRPWPPQTPVRVELIFEIERPATVQRPRPSTRPDVDKLSRAILDALTEAGVWKDDGQVVSLYVDEYYSLTPGVRIRVSDAPLDATPRWWRE